MSRSATELWADFKGPTIHDEDGTEQLLPKSTYRDGQWITEYRWLRRSPNGLSDRPAEKDATK